MASLQRVRSHGRSYWRIVESRRVNGKPRPVPIYYLGTADQLLEKLLAAPAGQLRVHSYQHGDVAALKVMADRLKVVSIIDGHVPASRGPVSVGTTLLLAAMNRAIDPRSKRGWSRWANQTSIHHLFSIRPEDLTSQYFWDQMDAVGEAALVGIEDDLTRRVVQEFEVKLDTLFYDTTNFFTYIASDNTRCQMAQRGRSKQRRSDLRQLSLALLVSREGHVPICWHVYQGNTVDAKSFPDSLTRIRQRLERLVGQVEDLTVVYDKGNNSKKNQALVDEAPFHYVASLVPGQHPELMKIPVTRYTPLGPGRLEGLPVYRCHQELWGADRTLILFISERLRDGQMRGLQQQLTKRLKALQEWKETLAKPRSGPRSPESAQRQVDALRVGQYLKEILRIEYQAQRQGADRLCWWIDQSARDHLQQEVFGKRLLMTDQHEWSSEEIILAYRGQSRAETQFRQIKDPHHLALRPQYHWTDQKVRVHTFICLLALMLSRLIELECQQAGYRGSLSRLLDLLGTVRLAMVLRSSGQKGGRPRCDWILEEGEAEPRRLFERLVPHKPPFVYTPYVDGTA